MRAPIALVLGTVGITALAGCGGSHLTGKSVEKIVLDHLGQRGYAGATVKCPDVNDKAGTTFTCDVSGAKSVTKAHGTVHAGDKVSIDSFS
jgi:hypothetical protein